MKKNIMLSLVLIIFSVVNLNAGDKKILPQEYYTEKNKNHWFESKGGPAFEIEFPKNYALSYIKLLNIFNKYYTNQNIKKEEIRDEKYFISFNNELLLEIKRIKGKAKYQKYRKMLFDFEVRENALFRQKKAGWDYKTAMEISHMIKISSPHTGFLGGRNLEKGEKELKKLMDKGIYSIGAIVMYFSNVWYQDRKSKKVIEWYEKYKDTIPDEALFRRKFVTDNLVKGIFRYYKNNGKEARGKELQQQLKDRIAKLEAKGMKYKYID